jgi:hypothetical protein
MITLFSEEVTSRKNIKKFIAYYAKKDNWHKLDKNKGNLGYGWLHYSLIRIMRPDKVLCIGSRYGFIPAVCALACKDNKRGVVEFVDAGFDMNDYRGPGEHWGGVGFWKRCDPKKYFAKFGLSKYLNLHVMTSEEFADKNSEMKFDFVHVDGDHSYDGVKHDYELFWPRINKGGFMAFHDIGSPDKDGNIYGTRKFWKEIRGKYSKIEFLEDPGVGIIQK